MHPYHALRHAALIGLLSTTSLLAQSISMEAVAQSSLTVTGQLASGDLVVEDVPEGTPLSDGFMLSTIGSGSVIGSASSHLALVEEPHYLRAQLDSFAWTAAGSGARAGAGLSQVLVRVDLAFSMPLDLEMGGWIVACSGQPTGEVKFDIGNDGSAEFVLTAQSQALEEGTSNQSVTLPAGVTEILISTELDMPLMQAATGSVVVSGSLVIRPTHTTTVSEGAGCGAGLEVAPLFDYNVRFTIAGEQAGDIPFLALGVARQQLPLPMPISMGCDLLITPDVLIPVQAATPEFIPLICMGRGEIFAQAAIFQPQALAGAQGSFRMSPRIAIEVH